MHRILPLALLTVLYAGDEPRLGQRAPMQPKSFAEGELLAPAEYRGRVLLVSRDGLLRRVAVNTVAARADMVAWKTGRAIWLTYCARCHGDDGRSEIYVNTRSLSGVGNRLNEEQIAQATRSFGAVDLTGFSKEELRGLWIFVAGL